MQIKQGPPLSPRPLVKHNQALRPRLEHIQVALHPRKRLLKHLRALKQAQVLKHRQAQDLEHRQSLVRKPVQAQEVRRPQKQTQEVKRLPKQDPSAPPRVLHPPLRKQALLVKHDHRLAQGRLQELLHKQSHRARARLSLKLQVRRPPRQRLLLLV